MTSLGGDTASAQASSGSSLQEDLVYYKSQYEQLEHELQDFQASSRELEAELEKDIDASEKRERQLKEKVEDLKFEVEEWKVSPRRLEDVTLLDQFCAIRGINSSCLQTKYKQSKAEAGNVQNTLQKEITSLRDTSRTLHLRLRDIEVANDDFERQARNTTSSLEDLESKYNVSIERGVMLEEEIKVGEQEREGLRIEAQRLREELSELKVEAEIVQEKLRLAESVGEGRYNRKRIISAESQGSPASEMSASVSIATTSSPTPSTPPPAKSETSATSDAPTPPSPPISDNSGAVKVNPITPASQKQPPTEDINITPKPFTFSNRTVRHSRGPSIPLPVSGRSTPSIIRPPLPTKSSRRTAGTLSSEVPKSGSLYQIRGLIGRMQKLEERVQSARSKLPAPTSTPPRSSPRSGSALDAQIPSTVTVRSGRKRASGIVTPSASSRHGDVNAATPSSRLSFGISAERPPSSASRPASRTSVHNYSATMYGRPPSRQNAGGSRAPLSNIRRPRSSLSGAFDNVHTAGTGAGASTRTSIGGGGASSVGTHDEDAPPATPRRSQTIQTSVTGIPTPSGLARRRSGSIGGVGGVGAGRMSAGGTGGRLSFGFASGSTVADDDLQGPAVATERPSSSGAGLMGPPSMRRKLAEVGETY